MYFPTVRSPIVLTLLGVAGLVGSSTLRASDESMSIHAAAALGDDEALYEIIAASPTSVFARDEHGDTALLIAARHLHPQAVLRLANANSDIEAKDRDGSTALHLALLHGERGEEWAKRRVDVVQFLLLQGTSVKAKDARGRTPLHIAAMMGRFETLESLRGIGAALDATDDLGRTPMHLAAQHGQLGVLNWLVRNKMSITVRDKRGYTPLHVAAERAQVDTLKRLIELGASASEVTEDGRTAIHLLAASDPTSISSTERIENVLNLLVEHGVDPATKDKSGATAAELAEKQKNVELANRIRSRHKK